jgi:hypothetical protein
VEKAETRLGKSLDEVRGRVDTAVADAAGRLAALEQEMERLRATLSFNAEHRERHHDREAFDGDRVSSHVERAVGAAAMDDDPMPHIVVHDLMPAATYRALIDGIPPAVCFSQKDRRKQDFKLSQADVIPEWTQTALGFMEERLIPEMLVPALVHRFESHIRATYALTYGPEVGARLAALPHVASAGRLMLRRPGYHLNPHLDPRRVVVTCLVYLARSGDSEQFGTTFFRISGTPVIDQRSTFYPEEKGLVCTFVKAAPFRANSAVAFLNARGAHGADIPKSAPARTERYAYQFYVGLEPAALAALVPGAGPALE